MADLDVLRTFLAVYRFRSITRAAASIHLSQPAVSQQVKALESDVGGPLFHRLARGVAPTERAHHLARAVAPHLDALAGLADVSRSDSRHPRRALYLGGPAEFLTVHAMPILAPLIATGLLIRARLGLSTDLLEALASRELDLVIATAHARHDGIAMEPLYQEELVLVASPLWQQRLGVEKLLPGGSNALLDVPLLAYAEDLPIIRRYWRLVFQETPAAVAVMIVADLRALRAAAVAGCGLTVLPRYLCHDELVAGRLVDLVQPAEPPRNTLYLAWRSDRVGEDRTSTVRQALLSAVFGT